MNFNTTKEAAQYLLDLLAELDNAFSVASKQVGNNDPSGAEAALRAVGVDWESSFRVAQAIPTHDGALLAYAVSCAALARDAALQVVSSFEYGNHGITETVGYMEGARKNIAAMQEIKRARDVAQQITGGNNGTV